MFHLEKRNLGFILLILFLVFSILGLWFYQRSLQKKQDKENIKEISTSIAKKQQIKSIKRQIYFWDDKDDPGFDFLRARGRILSPLRNASNGGLYFDFAPLNSCFPKKIEIYVSLLGQGKRVTIGLMQKGRVQAKEKEEAYRWLSSKVGQTVVIDLSHLRQSEEAHWKSVRDRHLDKASLVDWMRDVESKGFKSVLQCLPKKQNKVFFLRVIHDI